VCLLLSAFFHFTNLRLQSAAVSDAEARQLLADARDKAQRILEQLREERKQFEKPPPQALIDAIAAAEQALAAIEAALAERS
jgi:hypothetical protein